MTKKSISQNLSVAVYLLPFCLILQSEIEGKDNPVDDLSTVNTDDALQCTANYRSSDPKLIPVFGNVVRVDSVYGKDSTGARNGLPFLTINAALCAAQKGDVVWIFPGTYAESFTIPSGVTVRGLSQNAVEIKKDVKVATDLITMGKNTGLENVTLTLTSHKHVQLRGIVFPDTTSENATIKNVTVTVDNSQAGTGVSNVYGINANGAAKPGQEIIAAQQCQIVVRSTGQGIKRGILVDAANNFNMQNMSIAASNNGGGSAIGVETNHPDAACIMRTSNVNGSTADISQTNGTITLVSTNLVNANANGLGFSTEIAPATLVWATAGALPNGTNYMKVGTDTPTSNEMFIRVSQAMLVHALSIKARTSPGFIGQTPRVDTWTIRKNGIDQALTVSLSGAQTDNVNNVMSVPFAEGDLLSVKVVKAAGSTTSEAALVMDLY